MEHGPNAVGSKGWEDGLFWEVVPWYQDSKLDLDKCSYFPTITLRLMGYQNYRTVLECFATSLSSPVTSSRALWQWSSNQEHQEPVKSGRKTHWQLSVEPQATDSRGKRVDINYDRSCGFWQQGNLEEGRESGEAPHVESDDDLALMIVTEFSGHVSVHTEPNDKAGNS